MARAWGPPALAAIGSLLLAGACPGAATARMTTARSACGHPTRARRCANVLLDSSTSRARPAPLAPDGPCRHGGLALRPGNLALVDAAVICLINRQRALNGLAPLRPDPRLTSAAQRHSDDMAHLRFFDHRGSAGDSMGDRAGASGYLATGRAYTLGENIAWAAARRSTPAALVADWMASPVHRSNILDPAYRDTGIGLSAAPPTGFTRGVRGTTVTEDFGAVN